MKVVCLLLVTAALCFVKTNALSADFLETLMAAENTLEKRGKGKESGESSEEGTSRGKDESHKQRKGGFKPHRRPPGCDIDEDCEKYERRAGRTLVCNPDKKYCQPVDEPSKKKGGFVRPLRPGCDIDEDCEKYERRAGRTLVCNPDKKYCQPVDEPSKEKDSFIPRTPPACDIDEDCEKYERRAGRTLVCNPDKKYCQPADEPSKEKRGKGKESGESSEEGTSGGKDESHKQRKGGFKPHRRPPGCDIDEDCKEFEQRAGRTLICNPDKKYCQPADEPSKGKKEGGRGGRKQKSPKRRVLGSLIERLTEMLEE